MCLLLLDSVVCYITGSTNYYRALRARVSKQVTPDRVPVVTSLLQKYATLKSSLETELLRIYYL